MAKLRVLYVAHSSLMSGAEGALLDLVDALPREFEPLLAAPQGSLADVAAQRGISVLLLPAVTGSFRLHPRHTPQTLLDLVRAGTALRRHVRDHRVDLVHANSLRAGLIAGAGAVRRRTPVILHAHDVLPGGRVGAIVGAALGASADRLLTISDATARSFAGRFSGRTDVLYNPLDTRRFDPARRSRQAARAELGLPQDAELAGVVAQITPWKGQDVAIRAVARLRHRFPRLRLLIVGEPKFTDSAARFDSAAYLRSLHDLVAELGVSDIVEFWGQRNDVDRVTRALDILLSPSWEEPFGRSIIEAMALQAAVVATSVGGPPEYIVPGVDGLLVAPRDVAAWSAAIASLLGDPDEREAMAARASAGVRRRFERVAYAAAVGEVYHTLLSARR